MFIAYVLECLYALFGKHLYYLFLLNLAPFYIGLIFLVCGLYIHFRSFFALLPIAVLFVGNIYFQNFVQYHSFALPMLLFCAYSMLLFAILAPQKHKKARQILYFCIGFVFFIAILWRHNAIFSVFPAGFVIIYMWLSHRELSREVFLRAYGGGIFMFALLCLSTALCVPKILTQGIAYPANATFLHQIAAACVPADDVTCFKQEWYAPNKTWEDVKALYEEYPLNADPFNVPWAYDNERPFVHTQLKGLKSQWIKAIVKYPHNFLLHELRFLKAMWIQKPGWIFNAKDIQAKATHPWHISAVEGFPQDERAIRFSPKREYIYDFLYQHRLLFNHLWGVLLSACVMILSFCLCCKRKYRNALLLFSFSAGFAGFFSAIFIVSFTPVNETRYMSPILPLGIMALIGFVSFVCDRLKQN